MASLHGKHIWGGFFAGCLATFLLARTRTPDRLLIFAPVPERRAARASYLDENGEPVRVRTGDLLIKSLSAYISAQIIALLCITLFI